VAGLTVAALAAVAFLAYQASANVPDTLGKSSAPKAASSTAGGAPAQKKDPLAVPASSGAGKRVVYALHDRRVWLVGPTGQSTRTFPVVPSTVSPPPGAYTVTSRSSQVKGSDGVLIEHVVRFAKVGDVAVGFSAAVSGKIVPPDPALKTGGVRTKRADGDAMWTFATIASKIVVVP
jgi:hypothetical protein